MAEAGCLLKAQANLPLLATVTSSAQAQLLYVLYCRCTGFIRDLIYYLNALLFLLRASSLVPLIFCHINAVAVGDGHIKDKEEISNNEVRICTDNV